MNGRKNGRKEGRKEGRKKEKHRYHVYCRRRRRRRRRHRRRRTFIVQGTYVFIIYIWRISVVVSLVNQSKYNIL